MNLPGLDFQLGDDINALREHANNADPESVAVHLALAQAVEKRRRRQRGKVAVVGIGETTYYKHSMSPDPEFVLALKAILAACSDAGIDPHDVLLYRPSIRGGWPCSQGRHAQAPSPPRNFEFTCNRSAHLFAECSMNSGDHRDPLSSSSVRYEASSRSSTLAL